MCFQNLLHTFFLQILLQKVYWFGFKDTLNPYFSFQTHISRLGDYSVVFEALRGDGFRGDIALDDIKFFVGSCPTTAICDFEEKTICGFEHDPTADFEWRRNQGNTTTSNSGLHFLYWYFPIESGLCSFPLYS